MLNIPIALVLAQKIRQNWRREVEHLPAPARLVGFTLIELSIVLVIIGLIVGGVLVGQDLIKAAESRQMASRMESFVAAHNTFQLKYNCMPGDCKNAATLGLGDSGNGDRRIAMSNGSCYGGDYQYSSLINIIGVRPTGECQTFWVHLSSAELIPDEIGSVFPGTGTYTGSDVGDYMPEFISNKGYVTAFEYLGKVYFRTGVTSFNVNGVLYETASIEGMQMGQILNKFSVDASKVTGCPTSPVPNRGVSTNCLEAFNLPIIPLGFHTTYGAPWFVHTIGIGTGVKSCMTHVDGKAAPQVDGQCNMLWRLK